MSDTKAHEWLEVPMDRALSRRWRAYSAMMKRDPRWNAATVLDVVLDLVEADPVLRAQLKELGELEDELRKRKG